MLSSTVLVVVFSIVLFQYFKFTVVKEQIQKLTSHAEYIIKNNITVNTSLEEAYYQHDIKIGFYEEEKKKEKFLKQTKMGDKSYLTLYYPYKKNLFLSLTTQTTSLKIMISNILKNFIFMVIIAFFLTVFYAFFISKMLVLPIKQINYAIGRLDENFLEKISISNLPSEFHDLATRINLLIERIQNFIKYQKEFHIGITHELKTPLAVMKAKNEVTLLKPRDSQKYVEALKTNIQAVNDMNNMISTILKIGRQEGDQFEKPVEIDIIKFIQKEAINFKILAKQVNKDINLELSLDKLMIKTQPALFIHVLQNFVQNAIKFSQENSIITIQAYIQHECFYIKVANKGDLIDEQKDYFAPFKRYGKQGGVGLGLYLAKLAADGLNGHIKLQNNDTQDGVWAIFYKDISQKEDI